MAASILVLPSLQACLSLDMAIQLSRQSLWCSLRCSGQQQGLHANKSEVTFPLAQLNDALRPCKRPIRSPAALHSRMTAQPAQAMQLMNVEMDGYPAVGGGPCQMRGWPTRGMFLCCPPPGSCLSSWSAQPAGSSSQPGSVLFAVACLVFVGRRWSRRHRTTRRRVCGVVAGRRTRSYSSD